MSVKGQLNKPELAQIKFIFIFVGWIWFIRLLLAGDVITVEVNSNPWYNIYYIIKHFKKEKDEKKKSDVYSTYYLDTNHFYFLMKVLMLPSMIK